MTTPSFEPTLQQKINSLMDKRRPVQLGEITFDSPLLLAPMASVCNAPFRLLMQDLGAGGSVSELISCHGINHKNQKTMDMLYVHPEERHMGIQLFGEDTEAMAKAAEIAQEFKPKFIDINMGCPVNKVVKKGAGSAMMRDPKALVPYFKSIRKAIDIPLTVKIRTGWDAHSINALEVIKIAQDCGLEFVAVHGRTRAQKYMGQANWQFLEELADHSPLPIIGNGDLHQSFQVKEKMSATKCQALMIARGALRNPFIFLESYCDNDQQFHAQDYWQVISRLHHYITEVFTRESTHLIQLRKHIIWFAAGFPNAAHFRQRLFETPQLDDVMKITQDYFLSLGTRAKHINYAQAFMTSGHG